MEKFARTALRRGAASNNYSLPDILHFIKKLTSVSFFDINGVLVKQDDMVN
jgi:hypothetical protein